MSLTKLTRLDDIPRMIASISGHNGSGKTHLALTAPQPIAWLALDPGIEGVINPFLNVGLDIDLGEYYFDAKSGDEEEWKALYNELHADLYAALASDRYRTVVIDRFDLFYDLLRLGRAGRLSQISPFKYPDFYTDLRGVINTANQTDKNLLLLHTMKKTRVERTNSKGETEMVWDGKSYVRKGWSDVEEAVQAVFEITLDKKGRFLTTYKCRQKDELRAVEIENPTYRKIARRMFPNIPRGDFTKEFGPCVKIKEIKPKSERKKKK